MISLGSSTWGTSPTIGVSFAYEKQRSGANMQYRAKVTIATVTGASYFGYPIYLDLKMDGSTKTTQTLKNASPSQWSSAITYTSSWYTISNKVSGTTSVAFRIYSGSGSSRNTTYTYTMAVDPAGSSISASNGTLGVQQTLSITRYSSSFTDTISYTCGGTTATIASGSQATSISFTPPITLASENTSGTSVSITFSCATYSGADLVQTQTTTITCAIPATVKPSASVAISDNMGYEATYGAYVQSKSKLDITVTPTIAYGSAINSYSVSADGTTYTSASVTTPVLQNTGAQTVTATATDKRGRTSDAATASYTVIAYAQPYLSSCAIQRCDSGGVADPEGHYMSIDFVGVITDLNTINSAAWAIRYRIAGANTWTDVALSALNGNYTPTHQEVIAAADANAYEVEVRATDDFGTITVGSGSIPVAFTIMNWRTDGDGMAIGKINTQAGLEIAMDTDITGDTTFNGTVDLGVNVVPVANGGTGASTATTARTNLGIARAAVEIGTDNSWDYVKYDDNTYEAWYMEHPSTSTLAVTTKSGSIYRSSETGLTMPSFSTGLTNAQISGGSTGSVSWAGGRMNVVGNAVLFTIYSATSVTATYRVYVYVRGTY